MLNYGNYGNYMSYGMNPCFGASMYGMDPYFSGYYGMMNPQMLAHPYGSPSIWQNYVNQPRSAAKMTAMYGPQQLEYQHQVQIQNDTARLIRKLHSHVIQDEQDEISKTYDSLYNTIQSELKLTECIRNENETELAYQERLKESTRTKIDQIYMRVSGGRMLGEDIKLHSDTPFVQGIKDTFSLKAFGMDLSDRTTAESNLNKIDDRIMRKGYGVMKTAGGIVGGAGAGAAAGAIVGTCLGGPGIGTLIGTAVGGIWGFFSNYN